MRAHVWPPVTASGTSGAGAAPLPICPDESRPQHIPTPIDVMPHEKLSPALTEIHEWSPCTSAGRPVLGAVPMPRSPFELSPQHIAAPPRVTPHEWSVPASMVAQRRPPNT